MSWAIFYTRKPFGPGLPPWQVSSARHQLWTCYLVHSIDDFAVESTIIVSYIILYTVHVPVVRYIFLIVAVSCAGSAYPVIWPERIRALEGTVGSGIGIGWTNAMAQFSGVAGPHVFSTVFGPTYHVSYGICLAFLCVGIAAILTSWLLVWRRDREMRMERVEAGGGASHTTITQV